MAVVLEGAHVSFWHWNPHLGRELWDLAAGIWIGMIVPKLPLNWRNVISGSLIVYLFWPLFLIVWIAGTYLEHLEKNYPVE